MSPAVVVILTVDGSCNPSADFSTPFARVMSAGLLTAVSLTAASVTVKLTGITISVIWSALMEMFWL